MIYIIGLVALVGFAVWLKRNYSTVYIILTVNDTDIVTGAVNLATLVRESAAGNQVAVRDDPGIRVGLKLIDGLLHVLIYLDIGVGGVRLTKTLDVNVGSPIRFIRGETFRILDTPVPVDITIRIGA